MISAKRAAKLNAKKHREAERLFVAEGANIVGESPTPPACLFTDPHEIKKISSLSTPSGPIALFPFLDLAPGDLLRARDRIVLLEGVQDPGNVGTVLRSAHAFGAGVALSKGCADLYNPKTVRATVGSIFHAPVSRDLDAIGFLSLARDFGFASFAALPDGGEAPGLLPRGKLVISVGAEGAGLSDGVIGASTTRLTIPAIAASLNAATAASILLYEAQKRMLG